MIEAYGWNTFFSEHYKNNGIDLKVGRITAAHLETYTLAAEEGMIRAALSGRLRYQADSESELPVTGDWVYYIKDDTGDTALIYDLLPRRTVIARKRPGTDTEQVLAANADYLCVVSAMDGTLSPARIERYLLMATAGGAEPILLFNKIDLAEELETEKAKIRERFPGRKTFYVSALTGAGMEELIKFFEQGKTCALLGQSGAGKTSLANTLLGISLKTGAVREADSKGTHTTTSRELFAAPSGALFMDTPGLREVGLWCDSGDVDDLFEEILHLAGGCRFNDCTHTGEPDCTVIEALEKGELDRDVYDNYLKLIKEARALRGKKRWKDVSKEIRRFYSKSDKYGE